MHSIEPEKADENLVLIANTMGVHMSQGDAQPIARALHDVENLTILSEYQRPEETGARRW